MHDSYICPRRGECGRPPVGSPRVTPAWPGAVGPGASQAAHGGVRTGVGAGSSRAVEPGVSYRGVGPGSSWRWNLAFRTGAWGRALRGGGTWRFAPGRAAGLLRGRWSPAVPARAYGAGSSWAAWRFAPGA